MRREVSAIVVTRGDCDLTPVLDSLPAGWERLVWNNSEREDLSVFGRYEAIREASHEVVFVQDDDAVLASEAFAVLLAAYEPGTLVCNMPERFRVHYPDSALVGFGALFHRALPEAAFTWAKVDRADPLFRRTCDVVFTALTPRVLVDAAHRDLPYASAPNRMWKQPEHHGERQAVLRRCREIRDAA